MSEVKESIKSLESILSRTANAKERAILLATIKFLNYKLVMSEYKTD